MKKKKQSSRRLRPTSLPLSPAAFQEAITEYIDCSTTVSSATMTPPASEKFLESLKEYTYQTLSTLLLIFNSANRYYDAAALSDVLVVCDDHEFKVHRVILSAHSKYFTAELDGSWKV